MENVPFDVLCVILWMIDDIKAIEQVCKRWRDASRHRSYLKSSKDVAVSLLTRYPKLTKFDGTFILNLYDMPDRNLVFERAKVMKELRMSVIIIKLHKLEAVTAIRDIVTRAINLPCKTRINILAHVKNINHTINGIRQVRVHDVGYVEVCQQTMTINLNVSVCLNEFKDDFVAATKGEGNLTILHGEASTDYEVSWFIDLTYVKLNRLTLRYEGYSHRFNVINDAKQIKEIVFVYHGIYTPYNYDGYPGKVTYVSDS